MKSIFAEFIEIYINQVIFIRGLYPHQVFRKCKAYNLPVYNSIFPPLSEYIKNSMESIRDLLENDKLNRIEILINYQDDKEESFVIDDIDKFKIEEDDNFLLKIQDHFRSALYSLENKCKILDKCQRSKSCFKILLHTSERSYQKICAESKLNSLWIKVDTKPEKAKEVLPISMSSSNFFSLYVEQTSNSE